MGELSKLHTPPRGIAILTLVGPSLIWCAEYIGSGEVILATRTGSILGTSVLWAVVIGIFFKYWIGMSGARYTVCTGEGMIDMFNRLPGPKHYAVWVVLVVQFLSGAISIGSLAVAGGTFVSSLFPISSYMGGWTVTIFALIVVWSGIYSRLKVVMSLFVTIIVLGIGSVVVRVIPGVEGILIGLIPSEPVVPDWAVAIGAQTNPWREILPLIGWGAGGFASQVWYTYWVLGAGYGAAKGKSYGQAADEKELKSYTKEDAKKLLGWCRVVYADATIAMIIGTVITACFLIAGAGVLRPMKLAPEGPNVAFTLSNLFTVQWGEIGGTLFIIGGAAALVSTQVGQMAGWPRLLADTFRICIPGFSKRFTWKNQFRIFILFFVFTNMIIVYTLGLKPVFLVKLGALLDGLLLTPLQALWVGIGLFYIMPKMFSKEVGKILRPNTILGVGLILAFMIFSYFCFYQFPSIFFGK